MAHPIIAPAITIKQHSSMRNLFAVKEQMPAMVANITANPKYKEYIVQAIKRSNDYANRLIDMME